MKVPVVVLLDLSPETPRYRALGYEEEVLYGTDGLAYVPDWWRREVAPFFIGPLSREESEGLLTQSVTLWCDSCQRGKEIHPAQPYEDWSCVFTCENCGKEQFYPRSLTEDEHDEEEGLS